MHGTVLYEYLKGNKVQLDVRHCMPIAHAIGEIKHSWSACALVLFSCGNALTYVCNTRVSCKQNSNPMHIILYVYGLDNCID